MTDIGDQKLDKGFNVTRLEVSRFAAYTLIFFTVIYLQVRVSVRFVSNQTIQDYFFEETDNIFNRSYIGRLESLQWIDQQLYRAYNLNNLDLGNTYSEIIPITKLRVTTTMIKIDQKTGLWDKNMVRDKQIQGSRSQYHYNSSQNGYQLYFLPYSVLQFKQQNMGIQINTDPEYDDLKLIERGFLNTQTNNVKIDAAFYNGNINLIVVLQIELDYTPQGYVSGQFQVNTYIANAYLTLTDHIRMIMELLFLAIYAQFCILEVVKIRSQIKLAFDEDAKNESIAQRKKEKADEKLEARNVRERNTQFLETERFEAQPQQDNATININDALKQLEEIRLQMEEKINKLKKKVQLITLGLQRHVSDVWSALDVVALIILAIAIMDWVNANVDSEVYKHYQRILSNSKDFNSFFLGSGIESANSLCIDQSLRTQRYRKLVSISGLIMTVKLIKYFVCIFPDFQQYQIIMIRVSQYMVSFMMILFTIIIAVTEFFYFYYGSHVQELSTFYGSLNYIFGMILGVDDNLEQIFQYDQTLTYFVQLLFYLLISCVMLNMFYVFVICEFGVYEKYLDLKHERAHEEQIKVDVDQLDQKHPIWYFYETTEYLVLQFWFTFTLNRSKFSDFQHNKSQKARIYEREFRVNLQVIDYDTNFQSKDKQAGPESDSPQVSKKFLLQDEKLQGAQKQRVELVQLIWRSFILVILLILNFLLVQQFYSPEEAYSQNVTIQNQIKFGGQSTDPDLIEFSKIKQKVHITDWITNTFPILFEQILIGRKELQSMYGTPEPVQQDSSKTAKEQLSSYMYDEFQFNNLSTGTSLNFFNLIVNNLLRMTVRKSKTKDNPDNRFKVIYPTVKTFFPLDPKSPAQSVDEQTSIFQYFDGSTLLTEIEYSSDKGWANSGGYIFDLDIRSVGRSIKNLVQLRFFDFTTASLTLEFVTINPVNRACLAYVVVYFVLNEAGIVDNYGIEVNYIKQNSLQTLEELSIIILTMLLFIYLCYHFYKTMNTLKMKNDAYIKWYKTYITVVLSRAQIHFRHKRTPEFIRKWMFLLDVSQLLSFVYLALMGFQIALIILQLGKVNTLIEGATIYGQPVAKLFNLNIFGFGQPSDYLTTTYQITTISQIISVLASLAILVLCIELLYLLSNNQEFQVLTKSILYSLSHFPYVLVILLFFIVSFSFMGYFLLGSKNRDFCTFYGSSIQISTFIFTLDSMKPFRSATSATDFFLLVLPFIIIARFIIVNLFFAILYRGYHVTRRAIDIQKQSVQATLETQNGLNLKEFINLSWEMFNQKDRLPKPQSDLYLLQIIKQFKFKRVYSQIRENIRIQINMANISIWSQVCGSDIKDESDIREPLDKATQEIVEAYIKLNNQGDFQILEKINLEQDRKIIEYGLQFTYFDYFRQSFLQLDKFTSFFNHRICHIQTHMYSHLSNKQNFENENQYQIVLIGKYEDNLEENLNNLQYIRQEVEDMGLTFAIQKVREKKLEEEKQEKQEILLHSIVESKSNPSDQQNDMIQFQDTTTHQDTPRYQEGPIQLEIPKQLETVKLRGNMRSPSKAQTFNRKNIGIKFQDEDNTITDKQI